MSELAEVTVDILLFEGECYIHGLMDGEGMSYPRVWQDFAFR